MSSHEVCATGAMHLGLAYRSIQWDENTFFLSLEEKKVSTILACRSTSRSATYRRISTVFKSFFFFFPCLWKIIVAKHISCTRAPVRRRPTLYVVHATNAHESNRWTLVPSSSFPRKKDITGTLCICHRSKIIRYKGIKMFWVWSCRRWWLCRSNPWDTSEKILPKCTLI